MEKETTPKKVILKKRGKVVSNKADKTVVVAVDSYKTLKKYGKKYKSTKRYIAHDEENKCKTGDAVEITSIKPVSKNKKYKVV